MNDAMNATARDSATSSGSYVSIGTSRIAPMLMKCTAQIPAPMMSELTSSRRSVRLGLAAIASANPEVRMETASDAKEMPRS
jgi:hypothetical protein